jgi:hypothetical protein
MNIAEANRGHDSAALMADPDVRVLSEEGELLRHLTLDPSRDYQPLSTTR